MNSALERLLELPLDQGRLAILTHDNPDPDTIASAAALKLLLQKKRGIDSDVIYSGVIGRAENRAMVDLLHLPMTHLSKADLSRYGHIALIDAQPLTGNNAFPEDRVVDIVLDHHPLRKTTRRARFYDVRPELGASATLMTQYLHAAGVPIPRDLATALLYGIRSETHDLGREVDPADLEAYMSLIPQCDSAKLASISRPQLPRRYYAQLILALGAMEVGSTVSLAALGEVKDPDFIPEMADLGIRVEGIIWSLVTGTYNDRLYLSIRANDENANAGEVMIKVLEGLGSGGGHGMRAGGNVELGDRRAAGDQSVQELQNEISRRFLKAVNASGERLSPLNRLEVPEGRVAGFR